MSRTTLHEFARQYGQTKAAALLGMTQSSLNKALRVGRDIYVTKHIEGTYSAEEIRPFPCQVQPKKSDALPNPSSAA